MTSFKDKKKLYERRIKRSIEKNTDKGYICALNSLNSFVELVFKQPNYNECEKLNIIHDLLINTGLRND